MSEADGSVEAIDSARRDDPRWRADAELMARISMGDEASFLALFRAQQPRLLRLAVGIVRNLEDAQEIASDTLFALFRHAPRWEPRARVETWLYTVCVRQALSVRRRVTRAARHVFLPAAPRSIEDDLALKSAHRALRQAIDRLAPRDRAILALVLDHDAGAAELAVILEVAPGAARVALHRALQRLRALVNDDLRHLIPDDANVQLQHNTNNTQDTARSLHG